MKNKYVTTTFSTQITITCGCGANHSLTITQEEVSIKAIDDELHKLRCWLVDEAQWKRPSQGEIMCGRCYAMGGKKYRGN